VNTRSAGQFFALVLILSPPFYALGMTGAALPFAEALPISALMAMVPMLAAGVLVYRQGGLPLVGQFFRQAVDFRSVPNAWWVLAALAVMPVAFGLTIGLLWLSGAVLPALHLFPASTILGSFMMFFIGAAGEELGWQGYAYPRLIPHYSALQAALITGLVWALWHVIPFALMGRSAEWIIWQGAGMVLMRIIIVWLVVNTGGSILIAVLFHMMSNSVWGMFPDFGPYYDPKVLGMVLLAPVIAVVALWRPKTMGASR
jgi:uncharacterized protein